MEAAKEMILRSSSQALAPAPFLSQDAYLRHLMLAAAELSSEYSIVMHQDHGNSVDTCQAHHARLQPSG